MKIRMVPISKVATVNPRLPSELRDRDNLKVSFVSMADVSEEGRIIKTEDRELQSVKKGYTYFRRGDVLSAKITPCMQNGKASGTDDLPNEHGFGSTEFHVLRPGTELEGRYLFHMLWSSFYRRVAERNFTGTAGQQRVPTDFFSRFKIPLPSLPEQRRIAGILDAADAIRRKRQQAIGLTEQFLRSTFLDMFGDPVTNPKGWPVKPFAEVCDSRLGKMLDAGKRTGKDPRPYMRNINVQWGKLDLTTIWEMDFNEKDREEFRLTAGDVLICEGGAGVAQTAIWNGEIEECYFQKSLHRVRPEPEIATPQYIAYLIRMLMREGSDLYRLVSSATIPHLTGIKLKTLPTPVPPIKLQRSFADLIAQQTATRSRLLDTRVASDNLFNSLVQRAFRGEL